MRWPVVDIPKIAKSAISSADMDKQAAQEFAIRDAERVLAEFQCPEGTSAWVAQNAIEANLPARLIAADIAVESSCRSDVISSRGAVGMMQVMPRLYHAPKAVLTDPEANIRVGTRILAANIRQHGTRGGLQRYFGMTPGSTASVDYANRVLAKAVTR